MPARLLRADIDAPAFAVVGTYGQEPAVRHVGLLIRQAQLSPGCEAAVFQVGPPLFVDTPGGTTKAHVVGWADGLSENQRQGMCDWIQNIHTWLATQPPLGSGSEGRYRDYTVHPAAVLIHDQVTGREIYRFSCAGFVERCYAEGAQFPLIDHQSLPSISFADLLQIWREVAMFRDMRLAARFRLTLEAAQALAVQCGLDGDGPWRILLPGYLLHSLARHDLTKPYQPTPADRCFDDLSPG